jgi:protein-L-isoaspartate(D-aspartate) O-methyltransferase
MNQESLAFSDGSVNAVAIAPKVKSVIGIDFTPAMIARAEKKLEELNIENIDLINADIAAIDFAESSFDLITCSMAIALFPDIPQVLAKWYQWLKKGGSVATRSPIGCRNCDSSEQLSPRNREKCHRSGSMARCNHFFCHC